MRRSHALPALLAAALALTGCGGASNGGDPDERLAAVSADGPATSSLAQDLRPLHAEALELAELVLAASPEADVADVVARLQTTQQALLGRVDDTLAEAGRTPGEAGALTSGELAAARAATGDEAVRLGLDGLLRNHLDAVARAKAEVSEGRTGPAGELARRVLDEQGSALQELSRLS